MTAPRRSSGSDTRAIVHELGQPLSAILNNAQAARRFLAAETPDVVEARLAVNDIITQTKRVAVIYRRLETRLRQVEDGSEE